MTIKLQFRAAAPPACQKKSRSPKGAAVSVTSPPRLTQITLATDPAGGHDTR